MNHPNNHQICIDQNSLLINIATLDVICLARSDSLGMAARIMSEKRISSIVVIDENACPAGIVTERNILHAMQTGCLPETSIQKVMSSPVIAVPQTITCLDAYQICLRDGIRHLVIVDDKQSLIGVVAETDFRLHIDLSTLAGRRQVISSMNRSVSSFPPNASLLDAVSQMHSHNDSCVVVVENDRPVGIVTERDIVRLYSRDPHQTGIQLREVMASPVLTIPLDSTINSAAEQMLQHKVRHLVVINTTGTFAGLVSEYDLTHDMAVNLLDKKITVEGSYLSALLKTIPDLIWLKSVEGIYLACNPRVERFFGAKENEIIGKTDYHFVDKELADLFREQDRKAIREGKAVVEEKWVRFADDGHREYLEAIKTPMHDVQGNLIGILGIARDVTGRKQIEEHHSRLSAALVQSNEPVALVDIDVCYVYANPAFCKLFGYELYELVGKSINLVMPQGEDAGASSQETIVTANEFGTFQGEVKRRTKDGRIITILLKVSTFRNDQGEHIGYIANLTDLTETKRMVKQLQDSAILSQTILNSITEGLHGLNRDGNIIFENPAATKMLGWKLDEMIGQPAHKTMHHSRTDGSAYPQNECHIYATLSDGKTRHIRDEVFWRKDGTSFPVDYTSTSMLNAAGETIGTIVSFRDITELKQAEVALQQQNQFSEDIINSLPGVFCLLDMKGRFIRMNTQFMEVTGYSKAEFDYMTALDLFEGEDKALILQRMQEVFEKGNSDAEAELVTKSKRKIPFYFTGNRTSIDEQTYLVGIGMDITKEKQAKERIERLAHFDQLTGLPNRVLLNDHFKYALSLAQRNNRSLAVMFLDIDHFKDINDALGHSIGDQVLMEASKRIKTALREEDTLSRQGGDEFILILPGSDIDGAALIASKLINAVSQPCYIEQHELIVTPSIGIAVYPHDGTDLETLSKNADSAMYRAKREGRNDFRFYSPELQAQSARNLKLANALRHALERNELVLYYQPQLSIQDGHIIGAEALLRWQHPEIGLISPAEFIPIAEETGQIIPIGEWVLRSASKQLKDWMNRGMSPMVMAVNLSAIQFRQADLPELVTRILDEVKLPHQYLELELTEAAMMDNPMAAIAVMDNLHDRGIRMSIDDFGTGYSSLSYLKQFKVYKLKIDQSFVRDISEDPEDKAIVSAIINMACSLGLQTIAEGVETASQLAFLRLQGCNEVQGFYFSKPLTVEQFEVFARKP